MTPCRDYDRFNIAKWYQSRQYIYIISLPFSLSLFLSLNIYIKIISFVTRQYIRTLREQIYEARDMRGVPLLVVGNKQDELSPAAASGTRYRDIVNLVRKHWRCGYVECSARFNCRVVQVRITWKSIINRLTAMVDTRDQQFTTNAMVTDYQIVRHFDC